MKLDMPKWKALSIKNRLKKGFRLTTFVASASGLPDSSEKRRNIQYEDGIASM